MSAVTQQGAAAMIPLKQVQIAEPCHEPWDNMSGDDTVRYCGRCRLNVYNFSELSLEEIDQLIIEKEGRVCARLFRRRDGTVITRNCPVGVRAMWKRVAKVLAWGYCVVTGWVFLGPWGHSGHDGGRAASFQLPRPVQMVVNWFVVNTRGNYKLNNVQTQGLILMPGVVPDDRHDP
jgi:hypothetical protein